MSGHDDALMMRGLYWWGVPTLFACPHIQDPAGCDIALVGIPHSTGNGTTERDQHLGPRAVRNVSALQRRVHMGFGLDPWEAVRVADLGDVPLPEANDNERCIERDNRVFSEGGCGGCTARVDRRGSLDHRRRVAGAGRAGGAAGGGRAGGALAFRRAYGCVHQARPFPGARRRAQPIGGRILRTRGTWTPDAACRSGLRGNPRTLDWLQPSYDYGYRVVTMAEYREMGEAAAIARIRETLGDRPVYITFDLDCLDVTVAPGVSNLEPGEEGFRINEVKRLMGAVRGLNLIGGDVVCLMPTKDSPNQITALSAAVAMFEMIALMADAGRTA